MKFSEHKKYIEVYTNHIRPSNHLGNIVRTQRMGTVFYACGKEQTLTTVELRKIADKIDSFDLSTAK